jgi:hypothetical protein
MIKERSRPRLEGYIHDMGRERSTVKLLTMAEHERLDSLWSINLFGMYTHLDRSSASSSSTFWPDNHLFFGLPTSLLPRGLQPCSDSTNSKTLLVFYLWSIFISLFAYWSQKCHILILSHCNELYSRFVLYFSKDKSTGRTTTARFPAVVEIFLLATVTDRSWVQSSLKSRADEIRRKPATTHYTVTRSTQQ